MTTLRFTTNAARPALAVLGLGLGLAGCQPTIDATTPSPSAGSANFTRYIAVGNSLTADFALDLAARSRHCDVEHFANLR